MYEMDRQRTVPTDMVCEKEASPLAQDTTRDVLLISTMDGAEHCAQWIAGQVGSNVEVAATRRAGLVALRRAKFGVVVVEESLAESDSEWADLVWDLAGLAMPVQVNFAISGCARLSREVKAALLRRDGEQAVARRAAVTEIENDLKSAVTGLLLESQLVLREPTVPASLEPKLRHLVELAGLLRERLRGPAEISL
jgi:uncharacterized protein YfiM (DUF2279 family)